jgi:hypothetical protein
MKHTFFTALILLTILASCNKKKEFADFEYQTVYFAYQYPVRTITLGEDLNVNTDLDNAHKFQIYAATGGVYYSKKDVSIGIAVDSTLLGTGMLFGAGLAEVKPMPSNYYSLASDKIIIKEGKVAGPVDVQLTDAFFEDPAAIKNTYVIPLRMTTIVNADSILSGKNFVLYALKYVNPWHGNYLRRGKDVVTGDVNETRTRHKAYVEYDEVNKLYTRSLKVIEFPVVFKDKNGVNVTCPLLLTFDNEGKCTVSSSTPGLNASGTGSFVKRGEKNSWGAKDRDAIYLSYTMELPGIKIASTDTLVARDRAVTMETFAPVKK